MDRSITELSREREQDFKTEQPKNCPLPLCSFQCFLAIMSASVAFHSTLNESKIDSQIQSQNICPHWSEEILEHSTIEIPIKQWLAQST